MIIRGSIAALILLSLASCTGYDVERDSVYYIEWNEAQGKVKRNIGADSETFEVLKNDIYGKDNVRVYYKGNVINGADPKTFEFIGDLYAKDKTRAYYASDSIENSSSKDFKIIDSYYSLDYKDIYYTTKPLHVCKTSGFKIYSNPNNESEYQRWSTDGCFYYFMNYKIPSDDYKNVSLFRGSAGFAKDTRWVYLMDRKINVNDEGEKILDTVDVKTFTVTNYLDCKDKFGCINPYHGRENCEK